MARPRRLEASGVVYHVVARGNERRAVFRDNSGRSRYLARLAHYREKWGFRLLAFCLMDNHVHLAVETGRHIRIETASPSVSSDLHAVPAIVSGQLLTSHVVDDGA
jgi:REP element-mobilizing transposase RayT